MYDDVLIQEWVIEFMELVPINARLFYRKIKKILPIVYNAPYNVDKELVFIWYTWYSYGGKIRVFLLT